MEPGPDQGAKATWPHEQMTVENIVSIGDTWFEQLRTLMNTYLSGSAVHVFGKRSGIATSQQPFGPYHRRDQFKSPVAYATSIVRNEVLSHSDPDISAMDSRDFNFEGVGLNAKTREFIQQRGSHYMAAHYIPMYKELRSPALIMKHNQSGNKGQAALQAWTAPNVLDTYWRACIARAKLYITTGVSPELLQQAMRALDDEPAAHAARQLG